MRIRKILVAISGLDLGLPMGTMNAIWQFLKGMYEVGMEPIVVPYLGKHMNSLWWRAYPNPCKIESEVYLQLFHPMKGLPITKISGEGLGGGLVPKVARFVVRPKWKKALAAILDRERNVDAVLFWTIPLNHLVGIPTFIKRRYGIPVVFFDGDLPFSLPRYGGFTFNYYPGADLSEYDAFCGNSETALRELLEMGATRVEPVHFAADPDLFHPVPVEKQDIDVFFSAWGNRDREQWMREFITEPSLQTRHKFVIAGGGFTMDLGRARVVPFQPPASLRYFICRSKINLSITRQSVTVSMGSNSRPFELGALGACMISNPNQLIERWFRTGKEVFIAHDASEATELYDWLVNDSETRKKVGEAARNKVISHHTFRHRALQIARLIESVQ